MSESVRRSFPSTLVSLCSGTFRMSFRVVALGASLHLLGGCSSVPDAVNPVAWFSSDEENAQPRRNDAAAEDRPYPKLSSVPERPEVPTLEQQRKELAEGLVADTQNAEYTDQILRRETASADTGMASGNGAALSPPPVARILPPADEPRDTVAEARDSRPRSVPPPPEVTAPPPPKVIAPRAPEQAESPAASESTALPPVRVTAPPAEPEAEPVPKESREEVAEPRPAPPPQPVETPPQVSVRAPAPPLPPSTHESPAASTPPANPAPATPTAAVDPAQGESRQIGVIYFDNGSARLQQKDREVLQRIAEIQQKAGGRLRIVGHSSGAGASDTVHEGLINYKLSLDRANAVAAELMREGVSADRMEIEARGDRNPIYAESEAAGAAGNRRVEIFIVKGT